MGKTIFYFFAIFICCVVNGNAQVSIGTTPKDPEPFSVLELTPNDLGLRLSQLNREQKFKLAQTIGSQYEEESKGLLVYDLESKMIQYYDSSRWINVLGTINEGKKGQVLKLNDLNSLPVWGYLPIQYPRVGEYSIQTTLFTKDATGIETTFTNSFTNINKYYLNMPWSSGNWVHIAPLDIQLTLPNVGPQWSGKPGVRVSVQFQTGALIDGIVNTQGNVPVLDFAIGVFAGKNGQNYQLKVVRANEIVGNYLSNTSGGSNKKTYDSYVLMGMIEDLEPGETYTLRVGVSYRQLIKIRENTTHTVYIGKSTDLARNYYSSDAAQSSLKVDVYVLNH